MLNPQINRARIERNISDLAAFGMNSMGGITRPFASTADIKARQWIKSYWQNQLKGCFYIDPIANMWNRIEGKQELPSIVLGSHHDTVTNGGKLDGALGVLLATEVMQTVIEKNIKLRHPLAIVSFSGEEPNSFNISTLGSKVVSGKLKKDQLMEIRSEETGENLKDKVLMLGGNLEQLDQALLDPDKICVFLECHIEQGRQLYDKNLSLGVVTKIEGIYREKIVVQGEANHAGTAMMKQRHDALPAAAEIILDLEKTINHINIDTAVGTIGYIKGLPNSANIIMGEVELIMDLRTPDNDIRDRILKEFSRELVDISGRRDIAINREVILDQPATPMNDKVINTLSQGIEAISEPFVKIVSMAGHDAAHIARRAKTGMLFVPSIEGKSHCSSENTKIEDIEKAGNALLRTVLIIDKEFD